MYEGCSKKMIMILRENVLRKVAALNSTVHPICFDSKFTNESVLSSNCLRLYKGNFNWGPVIRPPDKPTQDFVVQWLLCPITKLVNPSRSQLFVYQLAMPWTLWQWKNSSFKFAPYIPLGLLQIKYLKYINVVVCYHTPWRPRSSAIMVDRSVCSVRQRPCSVANCRITTAKSCSDLCFSAAISSSALWLRSHLSFHADVSFSNFNIFFDI